MKIRDKEELTLKFLGGKFFGVNSPRAQFSKAEFPGGKFSEGIFLRTQ